jgi:hypothetical protein
LIDSALLEFERVFNDEAVEQFLPQLCQMVLGCSEPSFRNKTYFADDDDDDDDYDYIDREKGSAEVPVSADAESFDAALTQPEQLDPLLEGGAGGEGGGRREGDDEESLRGATVVGGRVQPIVDDKPGYYDRPLYLKLKPKPVLDPLTRFYFTAMRSRLEDALLRRCARNPALAVKLAWLMDDLATSPNSTAVVAQRATRIAFVSRYIHTNPDSELDHPSDTEDKDEQAEGVKNAEEGEGQDLEHAKKGPRDEHRKMRERGRKREEEEEAVRERRRVLWEAASLVDQLVSVAQEMGQVKKVYNVSRDSLVPEVKARLEWMNRQQVFRLAAAAGWVRKPFRGAAAMQTSEAKEEDTMRAGADDNEEGGDEWITNLWRHLDSPSTAGAAEAYAIEAAAAEEAATAAASATAATNMARDGVAAREAAEDEAARNATVAQDRHYQHQASSDYYPSEAVEGVSLEFLPSAPSSLERVNSDGFPQQQHEISDLKEEANMVIPSVVDTRISVGSMSDSSDQDRSGGGVDELLDLAQVEAYLAKERRDLLETKTLPLVIAPLGCRTLRVLRLLPEETLVLNSASRAPFMVMMELLESNCSATTTADAFSMVKKDWVGVPAASAASHTRRAKDKGREAGLSSKDPATSWSLNDEPEEGWLDDFLRYRIKYTDVSSQTWLEYLSQMCLLRSLRGGFGELWSEKVVRLREASPYGHMEGWRLASFMVKSSDDLQREMLAMQFIKLLEQVWHVQEVDVYLRPYAIVCTGPECGLLENIASARSLDSIKKGTVEAGPCLVSYLEELFPLPVTFHRTRQNFMRSLVPYSIFTWLFQIKDRHNGNILIDTFGHVVHIDFGYMLGESPGGDLRWEKSPFKLTEEFIDVLDGIGSPLWFEFEDLMIEAFAALQLHVEAVIDMVRISIPDEFEEKGLDEVLRERIMLDPEDVRMLIRAAIDSEHSTTYDVLQRQQNGIL